MTGDGKIVHTGGHRLPITLTQGCYTCFTKSMVQICCVFCACALMTEDGKIVQGDIGYRSHSHRDAILVLLRVWFRFVVFFVHVRS